MHFLINLFLPFLLISSAIAEENLERDQKEVFENQMVTSLLTNDYPLFIERGSKTFKDAITPDLFTQISALISNEMKDGYKLTFLNPITKFECTVYLSKIKAVHSSTERLIQL